MVKIYKSLILFGFLFICHFIFPQAAILPYQEIEGLPIVKVKIDGNDYNFVFDTGTAKTILNSTSIRGLEVIDSTKLFDINKQPIEFGVVNLPRLKIGGVLFKKLTISYKDLAFLNTQLCNLQIDGIWGLDMMKKYIVEIDPKNEVIKFYNRSEFNKKQLKPYTKFKFWGDPVLKLNVGGVKKFLVFDTGSIHGLNISDTKLVDYINSHQHTSFYLSYSIEDTRNKKKTYTKFCKIDTLDIQLRKLTLPNEDVLINNADINNMGFRFIKNYHTFLDLSKKKLYLKPNPKKSSYKTPDVFQYGFDLGHYKDDCLFYINRLTEFNDQLKIGDIVIKINSHKLPQEKCGLADFKKKYFSQEMKMTILRDGTKKVIAYRVSRKLRDFYPSEN